MANAFWKCLLGLTRVGCRQWTHNRVNLTLIGIRSGAITEFGGSGMCWWCLVVSLRGHVSVCVCVCVCVTPKTFKACVNCEVQQPMHVCVCVCVPI